ncbi:hypothetical protein [Maricaulis sp. W15]|uniref:hypothetical protein n=1 Tax=Maricaulis sp. W15 TaxID=1772333 RepID=UPI000A4AA8CE|nr:hypothetical protein [Maricaulis sp. W15]
MDEMTGMSVVIHLNPEMVGPDVKVPADGVRLDITRSGVAIVGPSQELHGGFAFHEDIAQLVADKRLTGEVFIYPSLGGHALDLDGDFVVLAAVEKSSSADQPAPVVVRSIGVGRFEPIVQRPRARTDP